MATRPIEDFSVYLEHLNEFVYKTTLFMKPIFSMARKDRKRIVLAEGEEPRMLHATQELVSMGLAYPILIGRPDVIEMRIKNWDCRLCRIRILKSLTMKVTRVLLNTGRNIIS